MFALFFCGNVVAQGRVVINEYLPWPSDNKCGSSSEFVELYNFGPGPVNIGCYVLTEGDFSITIPPNTILLPGEYFVLSGVDVLVAGCGNPDMDVPVQLNWNTCGCTSVPVPADGLFDDGGSANEQVVLMNAAGTVMDAVVRTLPAQPSSAITTASLSGGCTPFSFDLDDMTINYETIDISTGRANVFARQVDGDCGWVKSTSLSAGAPNFPGGTSSMNAQLTVTRGIACPNDGAAEIEVIASDYSSVFPMSFTLARDVDENLEYSENDAYTFGTDATAPYIPLSDLSEGRYRVVIESTKGCDLRSFDFVILNCHSILDPDETSIARPDEKDMELAIQTGTGRLRVGWNASRAPYKAVLYNMMGQIIHTEKITVPSNGFYTHQIENPALATGIYLFSLERTDGRPEKYIRRFAR